jgi:catechol 2,3-dioxygenase-like lactoylglutathione lyase family enzyme
MKLEVVVIPVSDVDRATEFYKALGWREDADFAASADFRVVQLTPPGCRAQPRGTRAMVRSRPSPTRTATAG